MAEKMERVGIVVRCVTCHRMKKPVGRSSALQDAGCNDECEGYRQAPYPGSLWPGETENEFGFSISDDGTELRASHTEDRG